MRVTFGTKYNQMGHYQNVLQSKISDTNSKIASGLKIRYGYEDSSVFNQNLKFEYEETTLNQGIDVANDALNYTINTDKALGELSQTAMQFNTRLIQAANDIHSPTSREAIARDLEKLRDHMINIANTSIGGEFIFGGSNVTVRPFNDDGTYNGNSELLKALISSENAIQYNVTGEELFFGRDLDHYKSISTNMPKFNQSKLNPDIMDQIRRGDIPEEVYIKPTDTLRDYIGDIDRDPENSTKEYFYVRGTRPDGTTFKAKFDFDTGFENEKNATKVQDVLDRIGKEFGNTPENKVVNVSMNFWGEIEIKSLRAGDSKLDFHMISSNMDVDNIDELPSSGARVTSYQKSPYLGEFTQGTISSVMDIRYGNYDHRQHILPTTFLTNANNPAETYTELKDVFSSDVSTIELIGTRPNNELGEIDARPIENLKINIEGKNIQDLLDEIKAHYGGDIDVRISNGEIRVMDNNVKNRSTDMFEPPYDGDSGFSFALRTLDSAGDEVYGMRADYKIEYDRMSFENQGGKLVSNVSQVKLDGKDFATTDTKLSEVAGGDLTGQIYNISIKDHNGIDVNAKIEFNSRSSYLVLPDPDNLANEIQIPLYNPHDEPPAVSLTPANEVTYKQLFDAISIALNYSNQPAEAYRTATLGVIGAPTQEGKMAYEELLSQANSKVNVVFNKEGQIEVHDMLNAISKMQFMIYNNETNEFSAEAIKKHTNFLSFNANNALTIDEPKTSFVKSLDEMINSVRLGIYRPGGKDGSYHADMRNAGIQNAITKMSHLSDHIEKVIALNGSHGKSFENAIRRNEVLKVQISSLKSDTIGADIAETYNHFNNLTTNYNAVLASTSRINQLSLVNYL